MTNTQRALLLPITWDEQPTITPPSGARTIRGTPAKPGTGPPGETCRTCAHRTHHNPGARAYQKCALMRHLWSRGPATDIKAGWPACRFWTAKDAHRGPDDDPTAPTTPPAA